jgi:ureidoglycolate lyase
MPLSIKPPSNSTIEVRPLNQNAFYDFGTVIENPLLSHLQFSTAESVPRNAVLANQGTALKYHNVTNMLDLYGTAPSRVPSRVVMNMFVCAPRALRRLPNGLQNAFTVEILERHPFTTQTFIPLSSSTVENEEPYYLVIVAPSLPPTDEDQSLPVPSSGACIPGRGLPDLRELKAFVARRSQAVTYGACTWHSPMVVTGPKPVDFVVVQFSNGVEIEDCQEVVVRCDYHDKGVQVLVPKSFEQQTHGSPKL